MKTDPKARHLANLMKAVSTLGPTWAFTRAQLIVGARLGLYKYRTPMHLWRALTLGTVLKAGIPTDPEKYAGWRNDHSPSFFFSQDSLGDVRGSIGKGAVERADRILLGEFPFFGDFQHLGFPPRWQGTAHSDSQVASKHWSAIDEFQSGDIKLIWEPNRFSWVFDLARAYTLTKHEPYAEAFWVLLESWLEENQPNKGVNWKCGQEASFRVMALCFGLYAFAPCPSSTAERVARLTIAIAIHARRINAYIAYAISQKNNHGISEGVGLWTVGLLFPELRASVEWKKRGREVIVKEVRRQIYVDGSYIQHSMNYHRVLLHDLVWAIRLGELHEETFPEDIYELFRRSVQFLHAVTDPLSGYAPNYGANDGALVLPLSDCSYPDMRPVLQACHFVTEKKRLYCRGPWDEEMVWLNGHKSEAVEDLQRVSRKDLNAEVGGYSTTSSCDSWLMVRAAKYKDRPSHADQLHIDMWWRGVNVLCDPGTYSYNAPQPFEHGFAATRYHNCVTVDGADQMTKVSRFLWADWASAEIRCPAHSGTVHEILQGEHDGYQSRGVQHRRTVARVEPSIWIIVDDLTGSGTHGLRLHWLTQDVPFSVIAQGILKCKFKHGQMRLYLSSNKRAQFHVVRAGHCIFGENTHPPDPAQGWVSRYYAQKEPALSIALECRDSLPVRFVTVVELGSESNVCLTPDLREITVDGTKASLSDMGCSPTIV